MQTDTTIDRMRSDSGALLDVLLEAGAEIRKPNEIRCPWHDDQHASAGVFTCGNSKTRSHTFFLNRQTAQPAVKDDRP